MSGEAADAWTGDERKRTIVALWSDVDRLRDEHDRKQLDQNRRPVTKKEMAKAVGVSDSTLGDWLNKRTVVPEWPELEKLIRFLGGRPEEWQPGWRRAMSAYQSRPRGRTSMTTTDPEASQPAPKVGPDVVESLVLDGLGGPERRRWRERRHVLITLAVVVLLVVVLLLMQRPGMNEPPRTWQATVVNTWSSSRQKDVGIRPHLDPNQADQTYPGYFTSDVVPVSCHDEGRVVEDKTTHERSKRWYRLNDGSWLPGLFLQFDGRSGTAPPADMPACKP